MALIYTGVNVKDIIYNGVSIDRLYMNGVLVYSKGSNLPESLSFNLNGIAKNQEDRSFTYPYSNTINLT